MLARLEAQAEELGRMKNEVEHRRARIAELEALLESRTQTIVGLGARLAELQGDAAPSTAARLRHAEDELARLRATKVIRWSAVPRRWYGRVRGFVRG